ncbi:hypothetical protein FB107DRAFT_289564 [Schizophyllum commune]|nr:hypothetical protein K525DRAFT_204222 [Schizophyllum commune Loenen D]
MAYAARKQAAQELNAIANKWVQDPFRPHLQLSFFLRSLATHPRLTPEAVNAARALQENVAYKKYKLSDRMLHPASRPRVYDDLLVNIENSVKGTHKPWWKDFFGIQ